MRIQQRARMAFVSALMLTFTACAGSLPPQAKYLHPEFSRAQIRTIALLPIVDARLDQTERIDLADYFLTPLREALAHKGYRVATATLAAPLLPSATDAHLSTASTNERFVRP